VVLAWAAEAAVAAAVLVLLPLHLLLPCLPLLHPVVQNSKLYQSWAICLLDPIQGL